MEESGLVETDGKRIFVEHLQQPVRLVICGGGHVAQQTAFLTGRTGFHVTALEDRPFFADAMRKAGADQVICDSFENALKGIRGSRNTYFLVLTRGHRYDGICLKAILQKERAYTGMMASRGRAAAMRRQLKEEGIPEEVLDAIHSPVGLSIHAETPQEIAVSITAELIQEKNRFRKSTGYDDELLAFLTGERNPGGKIALAEIGTKMAVLPDGRLIGTIGGGCMESRVMHQCLRILKEADPRPRLTEEILTGEEAGEEGLVCGGRIQVFLEVL